MKAINFKIALVLVVCIGIFTCTPASSQNSGKSKGKVKSIALVSTMMGKIVQEPIPILAAPLFNSKTNSIAALIIKEEEESINGYRDTIASKLRKYFNCVVVYGDSLMSNQAFQEVIKKYNYPDHLKIENENFPSVIIPKGETNLFMISNSKNVIGSLKNDDITKRTTSELCKVLGTDLVAVSYSHMWVIAYGALGMNAIIVLQSVICLYNTEGELIGYKLISGTKNKVKAVGDDINDYKAVLSKFPSVADELVAKVSEKVH